MGTLKYILILFCFLGITDSQDYETIEWSAERKLTWNDFKGRIPNSDRAAAVTASGISYRFSSAGTKDKMELDYKVNTFFYPNKSWYQPSLCDTLILSHEQLHFDISELYARKMRERLATETFSQNVKAEVKKIYREVLRELESFQRQYDTETNFSRNIEEQLIWNKKLEAALK